MVKKQQMRWSHQGAHLLLQIRTRVLNGDWEDTFRRWYPGFFELTHSPCTLKQVDNAQRVSSHTA